MRRVVCKPLFSLCAKRGGHHHAHPGRYPGSAGKYDYIVVLEEEAVDMELEGGYAELGREGVYRTEEVERD